MYDFGMPVTGMIEWISFGAERITRRGNMGTDSSQMRYFRSSHTSKAMITIAASIRNSGE